MRDMRLLCKRLWTRTGSRNLDKELTAHRQRNLTRTNDLVLIKSPKISKAVLDGRAKRFSVARDDDHIVRNE